MTMLIQLNIYLLYNRPSQFLTSLPYDEIKEMLYHAMPNLWKKEIIEDGFNLLVSLIQPMVEFFETRIEN